jgi:hypothetical protein
MIKKHMSSYFRKGSQIEALVVGFFFLGAVSFFSFLLPNYAFSNALGITNACAQEQQDQKIENKKIDSQQTSKVELSFSDTKINSDLVTILKEYINKKEEKKGLWSNILPTLIPYVAGGLIALILPLMTLRHQKRRELIIDQKDIKLEELRNSLASSREIALLEANRKRDISLEETRTKLGTAREKLDLERRRLENFYAPLLALFQQSRGVTDKLCQYFYDEYKKNKWNDCSPKYEFEFMTSEEAEKGVCNKINPAGIMPDRRLYVKTNKGWIKFRLLDFMPWLLKDRYCRALVDQIIRIGERKVEIISKYAGLAAVSGERPSPLFGAYLAHYSLLTTIRGTPPNDALEPESQKVGYYPRGLDDEVLRGYDKAREDINKWERILTQD